MSEDKRRSYSDLRLDEEGRLIDRGAGKGGPAAADGDGINRSRPRTGGKRPPSRKRKKRRRGGALWGLVVVAVAVLVFFGMFHTMRKRVREPVVLGEEVAVTIPEGASTAEVASILKAGGLLKNTLVFKLESKLRGNDGSYQSGTHILQEGMDNETMMRILKQKVEREQLRLTIPEGFTAENIAARVEELGICTAEEFMAAANSRDYSYDFVASLPERPVLLEGYLFPETYFVYADASAHDIVDRLLGQFVTVMSQYESELAASSSSMDEIVTMASLVQSEIQLDSERATCASVIYNRLNAGMRLQLDATVLYAQGVVKEDVTYADLEIDSPYNTYRNDGLPLGPISNPGQASLEAALRPENTEYLYYVLTKRGESEHTFTKTYEEFEKAKAAYKNS